VVKAANIIIITITGLLIRKTVDNQKRQGVEPDVILAFRGLSVRLISEDREQIELEENMHLDKIAKQLADLKAQGYANFPIY